MARLARHILAVRGIAQRCLVRLVPAVSGEARLAWLGSARRSKSRHSSAGMAGQSGLLPGSVRHDKVWQGKAGMAPRGPARRDMFASVRGGASARRGRAGTAGHDGARSGSAEHGQAEHVATWQGWRGMARPGSA